MADPMTLATAALPTTNTTQAEREEPTKQIKFQTVSNTENQIILGSRKQIDLPCFCLLAVCAATDISFFCFRLEAVLRSFARPVSVM